MRVVSMVPSWTETLLHAGVDVVGRTRYCIHPGEKVASIPVVGGTKHVEWTKVVELKPDLLVLDREENPYVMAKQSPVPWIATHVTSAWDVETELRRFHDRLCRPELPAMAERWRDVCTRLDGQTREPAWPLLPGVIEWMRAPGPRVDRFLYLIWKDPWMAAGPDSFIGSMFQLLGLAARMLPLKGRYPTVGLEDVDPARTLLLFSSEPYPFREQKNAIRELPFPSAIVDGACFSWFGIRALRFLEEHSV